MMKILQISFILVWGMMLLSRVHAQAPVITNLSPMDNAEGISPQVNLVITFDQEVLKGVGNIVVRKKWDQTYNQTIDVNSTRVEIDGNVARVDPVYSLDNASVYYVQVTPGAFTNSEGDSFIGFSNDYTWNFNTGCGLTPTNLGTSSLFNNFAVLVWDEMEGASDYTVWLSGQGLYKTTEGNNYFPVSNLAPGTTYTWTVRSKCTETFYSPAAYGEFTTPGTNPCAVAPTLQNPTNVTSSSIKLNWANKTGASDYQLWVSGVGTIASTNSLNTYTLQNLAPGTTYSWSVKTVCANNGIYSVSNPSTGQFTTSGTNPCTAAPVIQPTTNITTNSVTLNWEFKEGVSDYQVWISGRGLISTTNGSNSITVDNLPAGTTFKWTVKSVCKSNGNYIFSASSSSQFSTIGDNPCDVAPEILAPTNIEENSITLNWESKPGATDYQIWISGRGTIKTTHGINSYTVNNLPAGSTFNWSVKSICAGNGTYTYSSSSYGEFTTLGVNSCASAPEGLAAVAETNSVYLTWEMKDNAADYQIWISNRGVIQSTGGQNFYTVTGLPSGATFEWGVRAICNSTGTYNFSAFNYDVFTTSDEVPLAENLILADKVNLETQAKTIDEVDKVNISEITLALFPNPSTDQVNLQISGDDFISAIIIRDLSGRLIQHLEGIDKVAETISLRGYGSGIYILNIITNSNEIFVRKVVIQ